MTTPPNKKRENNHGPNEEKAPGPQKKEKNRKKKKENATKSLNVKTTVKGALAKETPKKNTLRGNRRGTDNKYPTRRLFLLPRRVFIVSASPYYCHEGYLFSAHPFCAAKPPLTVVFTLIDLWRFILFFVFLFLGGCSFNNQNKTPKDRHMDVPGEQKAGMPSKDAVRS